MLHLRWLSFLMHIHRNTDELLAPLVNHIQRENGQASVESVDGSTGPSQYLSVTIKPQDRCPLCIQSVVIVVLSSVSSPSHWQPLAQASFTNTNLVPDQVMASCRKSACTEVVPLVLHVAHLPKQTMGTLRIAVFRLYCQRRQRDRQREVDSEIQRQIDRVRQL